MNYERHKAIVVANDNTENPKKRGEIKVACAGILGDEETALPDWIPPVLDWGWFYVPDIGEIVEIELNTSDGTDEIAGQSSIDGMDIHWRGKRFFTGDTMEENNEVRELNSKFLTNYPKRRGFATPNGHIFLFDDKDGSQKIELTWMQGGQASTFVFDSDGTVKISIFGGDHYIHLKENEVKVQLDGSNNLTLTDKDADATMTLGDGAVSVAIAETLNTLWDGMVQTFANHTHIDSMGGTGIVNSGPMNAWDSQINSAKAKIPDN